ncbi:MAG: glycosyltransferase family 2 protein [Clostridia bacterium]|nr:glycosyltransferase family 2 protein [Clostridia bacterium]
MEAQHTFVVCAYGESPYLRECVQSLLAQTVQSKILIATSTPNEWIQSIASEYALPVYVNEGEKGIAGDWNFAMSCADTEYVTLAHQDDIYEPTYAEEVLRAAQKAKKPIIAFTEYFEIRKSERVFKNKLLRVKHLMNFPFRIFKKSRFVRRRILSLGCSICCPAVTYHVKNCKELKFNTDFQNSCDWDAWERISKHKGSFVYLNKPLMGHRIHRESTTTEMIQNSRRAKEELIMFKRFWPNWIAKRIAKIFEKSTKSNDLDT